MIFHKILLELRMKRLKLVQKTRRIIFSKEIQFNLHRSIHNFAEKSL